MVKTKTALDQTSLNASHQTPYLDIDSEQDNTTKADTLKAKAVVIIDPLTGKALGASDFFLAQQPFLQVTTANPVSTTIYPILTEQKNCRIIGITARITWGVTQPTPLEVIVTIDGVTMIASQANPVTTTVYLPYLDIFGSALQMTTIDTIIGGRSFLLEGRSVKIDARITWAVTQPTDLRINVMYAKR